MDGGSLSASQSGEGVRPTLAAVVVLVGADSGSECGGVCPAAWVAEGWGPGGCGGVGRGRLGGTATDADRTA